MTMLIQAVHAAVVSCRVCYDWAEPTPATRGVVSTEGDYMHACHTAMAHIEETGHEPVTVVCTSTGTYRKDSA